MLVLFHSDERGRRIGRDGEDLQGLLAFEGLKEERLDFEIFVRDVEADGQFGSEEGREE
jgi:hypothetical protein